MNLDLLHDVHLHRNRLLRSAAQLLTTPPGDPVLGEFLFAASGAAQGPLHLLHYDGVSGQGSPASTWAILASVNRNETVSGLWQWNPPARGAGTADGEKAPFTLGTNCAFDAAGILRNRVQNLNADLVDGRHVLEYVGTSAPSAGFIPAYGGSGQLAVSDPVNDYDAVNRKTWQAGLSGLVVLSPCRVASTVRFAGNRSGNVITATANGALVIDGVTLAVNDRVLLKDQQSGGTAVDNGVFTVTATGNAGAPAVLTRAADADQTGELTVGSLVFVQEGTVNRATQRSCQKAPGQTGSVIAINTDEQFWQLSFQQSAYTAGRGLVLNGLEFNFSQNADYQVGSIFWANAARTVTPLLPPPSAINQFLGYNQTTTRPEWGSITTGAISNWPNPILPGTPRTAFYHARFGSDVATIQDSYLMDDTTAGITSVVAPLNSIASATVGLGTDTRPWASLWSKVLRLAPVAGNGSIGGLLGTQDITTDPNANHRQVVGWPAPIVKAWLGITPSDIGAVPISRQLTLAGTSGQINVGPQATWDLSENRTWTFSLDLATLDTHWVTRHTDQTISGTKAWYSVAGDSAEVMVSMALADTAEPTLKILAGGALLLGDGVSPALGRIDFASNRLRVSGRDLEVATSSVVWLKSAVTGAGTPQTMLGLTTDDRVQKVTAADLAAFVGQPTLAAGAVGFGDSNNRLTGDATRLNWDATNFRLGINTAVPGYALDLTGTLNVQRTLGTGSALTYAGSRLLVDDTSTSSTDWTNRTYIGAYHLVTKSGSATFVTQGFLEGIRTQVNLSGGTVSQTFGYKLLLGIGGPGVNGGIVSGFWAQPYGALNNQGTISVLQLFAAADVVGSYPQAAEFYGYRCHNLSSIAGATRTAGLRLDMSTPGTGERYNIYAPGTAPSYLSGNLGLGATAPVARLEFAVGTTTLAPTRFGPTSSTSSLLTTPLAGALESRGDRLTFTDTTAVRRLIAHLDDYGFTNDPAALAAGGIVFGPADRVAVSLTPEDIGPDPFTLWMRFLVPTVFRGPSADAIAGLTTNATGSSVVNTCLLWLDSAGTLRFTFYGTSGGNTRFLSASGFRTAYAGQIVDIVVVRNGTAIPAIYANGKALSVTETTQGTPPGWDNDLGAQYFLVGNSNATNGSVTRIHRAVLFNRPLSASEVLSLSSVGLSDTDQWGSTQPTITDDFGSGLSGWAAVDAANNNLAFNQTVNGSTGWLTVSHVNATGSANLFRNNTGGRINKHWNLRYLAWRTTAQPAFAGMSCGAVTGSQGKQSLSASTETEISGYAIGLVQTSSPQIRVEPGTTAGVGTDSSIPAGSIYAIKNVRTYQVGAVVDLNLGIGCGSAIPDLSGRYHGTLSGTTWSHYVPRCPIEAPSGPGTVSTGLRRFTQTISAKDGDTVTVTHDLGSQNLTVGVWSATGQWVQAAVQRKVGAESTAIEIGFALVGAPSTPVNFVVVVIG